MWNARLFRLTFFVDSNNFFNEFDFEKFWKSVIDLVPMKSEDPKKGIVVYKAILEENQIEISMQISQEGRIDWIYRVESDIDNLNRKLNSLGKVEDSIKDFFLLQEKICMNIPEKMYRVALGTIAHVDATNIQDARNCLESYLPMKTTDYDELALRTNHIDEWTLSNKEIKLNKIQKFEILKLKGQKLSDSGKIIDLGEIIAPQYEIDVNTSIENNFEEGFLKKNIEDILEKFMDLTMDLYKVKNTK